MQIDPEQFADVFADLLLTADLDVRQRAVEEFRDRVRRNPQAENASGLLALANELDRLNGMFVGGLEDVERYLNGEGDTDAS